MPLRNVHSIQHFRIFSVFFLQFNCECDYQAQGVQWRPFGDLTFFTVILSLCRSSWRYIIGIYAKTKKRKKEKTNRLLTTRRLIDPLNSERERERERQSLSEESPIHYQRAPVLNTCTLESSDKSNINRWKLTVKYNNCKPSHQSIGMPMWDCPMCHNWLSESQNVSLLAIRFKWTKTIDYRWR